MTMTPRGPELLAFGLLVAGCGGPSGSWSLTGAGSDLVEGGIPATLDGCSVAFDRFLISWDGRFIEGPGGAVVAEVVGAQVYDFVPAGPHDLGTATNVPVGDWEHVHAIHQPAAASPGNVDAATTAELAELSMLLGGEVTCGGDSVTFSWAFDRMTKQHCYAEVTIPDGGEGTTAYTVAGELLFATGLQAFDGLYAGQPIVDADADGDGAVTLAELAAVQRADVGYDPGSWDGIDTLADYVTVQTFYFVRSDGEQCTPEILSAPYVAGG